MTKASDNLFPKIILNEAATDGSDFSNPAADYRTLFLGEDGALHLKDSAGAVSTVGSAAPVPNFYRYNRTAGDYSIASGTWTDIDGTNVKATLTTGANPVRVSLQGILDFSGYPSAGAWLRVDIDGTLYQLFHQAFAHLQWLGLSWVSPALTAASHVVKLQWAIDSGTMYLRANANIPLLFAVEELH